jgi:hypothetical protein
MQQLEVKRPRAASTLAPVALNTHKPLTVVTTVLRKPPTSSSAVIAYAPSPAATASTAVSSKTAATRKRARAAVEAAAAAASTPFEFKGVRLSHPPSHDETDTECGDLLRSSKRAHIRDTRQDIVVFDSPALLEAQDAESSDPCFAQLATEVGRLKYAVDEAVRHGNVALCRALVAALKTAFAPHSDVVHAQEPVCAERVFTAGDFPVDSVVVDQATGTHGVVKSVSDESLLVKWRNDCSVEALHFQQFKRASIKDRPSRDWESMFS